MTAQRGCNPFSGASLERRSEARHEANWVTQALDDSATRFVVSSGVRHLLRRAPQPSIAFVDASNPLVTRADPARMTLLGWYQGARCVLIDAPIDTDAKSGGSALPAGTTLEELRPLLVELPHTEANLLAYARALMIWRARHRHCGVCGAPTTLRNAGHSLVCSRSDCATEVFPRIDPAVIVLVSDGEHALLGRQPSFPPGRYSALAGFVEPGESLEDTVIREVQEESGAQATAVHYFASQPWPFPSSLMLGFHATATRSDPIVLDGELEDARWFNAAEMAHLGSTLLPPPHTIARSLINFWYHRVTGRDL